MIKPLRGCRCVSSRPAARSWSPPSSMPTLPRKINSRRSTSGAGTWNWICETSRSTLGMERLRCKSPEMATKELWAYLLAYNMIRLLMAQAALLADQVPRQLSFKHTVQVRLSWQRRGGATPDGVAILALLVLIAEPRVGLRPGRIEPRVVKRRRNQYPLMTKPRAQARAEVIEHGHPKKQR